MSERETIETLIVGGGPAGAFAAALLAKAGREVTLIERTTEPHEKLCGDFLSGEAARPLARIGLDPIRLGAVPVETLRVVIGRRVIETRLPFPAYGLSRRVIDEAVIERATLYGADLRRGLAVRRLTRQGDTWRALIDGDRLLDAEHVVLATGKHDLHGFARETDKRQSADQSTQWLGMKMPMRLSTPARAALGAAIELYVFRHFYAGLQSLPGRDANLCLAIPKRIFHEYGGTWRALVAAMQEQAPVLQQRLHDAAPHRDRPLAIARVPYGFIADSAADDGLVRIGDQAAVVPSFTGDGVAMALRSAEIATACVLEGEAPRAAAAIAASHAPIVRRAATLAAAALSAPGVKLLGALLPLAPRLAGSFAAMTRVA
jgi:flavin-dependent dehydrogenase